MAELNKITSAYNKRSIPKTAANLWMYFGSSIGRFENTGQVQFIKGQHSIGTYTGTAESELLLPKLDTVKIPDTEIPPLVPSLPIAESTESVAVLSSEGTTVTQKKIDGGGKIKAIKHKYPNLERTMTFNLFGDIEAHTSIMPESVPTFTGDMSVFVKTARIVNDKEILLPGVKLFLDLLAGDFENTGSIACLEFLVRNCGIFRNKSRIETHADIDVMAKQILNVGDPTITPRSTASVAHNNYGYGHGGSIRYETRFIGVTPYFTTGGVSEAPRNFSFHSVGKGFLKSQGGKVKLNGAELVQNEHSSIMAANGFSLTSQGKIINHLGNLHSVSAEPSYIQSALFEHSCRNAEIVVTGSCWYQHFAWGKGGPVHHSHMEATFDTSSKPEIYTGGDLFIQTTQFPTIKGADIFSGGTVKFDFQTGKFNAEQVHNNIPTIAVHDNILINGEDVGIKGARFVAGMGIVMTATGKVAIINPDGNQVILPPTGAIDINVSELAKKSYGHMLMTPQLESPSLGIVPVHRMVLDPTSGIRKLFFGRMPDPTKKLIFDTRILSALPMILAKYEPLLGTRVLNMPKFLTLLDENAQELDGAIIPANQMPNKLLMYFTVEDGDKEGEQNTSLHINVPVEELGKTLSKTFEVRSEHDLLSIRGSEVDLKNAVLSGSSVEIIAKKDPTVLTSGKVSMVASEITATKDKVHIHGDDVVDVKGRFDKTTHHYSIDGGYAGLETATHVPSVITGPEVAISGGTAEIRGTLVKARTFVDETERLLIGVDKTALRYWSHAEKESGGMFGGSSSISRSGSQEIAYPSILEVEEMLSGNGQSLILESVIAEGLQRLLVEKPIFKEIVATLHSHDKVKVESDGFSLFGLGGAPSVPTDPLIGAFASLSRAQNSKAMIADAIKAAASIYGSMDDASRLFNAVTSGISLDTASIIACTLAKRYVNLGISFGSQTTTTTSHQTQQLPNKISAELIELRCPTAVHLQGQHTAKDFIVETESFTTTDIVNTAKVESKTESTGGSFNPVSAVASYLMPALPGTESIGLGMAAIGAVSGSVSDVTQNQSQTMRTPTTVIADKFILRAGSAHLTDTQIKARLVDAIIRDDLVIESLTDEFFSEAKGGNFGTGLGFLSLVNGIQNMTDAARVASGMGGGIVDVKEIERKVNTFAGIVGEEDFCLKVGGTLLARSAFYGQMDKGQAVTAPRMSEQSSNPKEHIEVGNAVHEVVQEEHVRKDDSYAIPIGDAVNVTMSTMQLYEYLAQPTEKEKLAGEVYKKARTEGKTHAEAREESDAAGKATEEFFEKEDVKKDYQKLKQAQLKQKQAKQAVEILEAENPTLKNTHAMKAPTVTEKPSEINTSEMLKLFEYTRAREVQNSAAREAFSIASDIREKAEVFAREHPTFAKWSGYALKGVGTVAIAGALISAAEIGVVALLTTGTSIIATDQAMAAVIENGTESFVEYAASQGTTELEAKKFADTAVWTVEALLTGAATVGVTKFIKNSGAVLTKLGTIKGNLGNLAKTAFQRTQSSTTKIDSISAGGMFDAVNKSPYNPRLMEIMLKSRYGDDAVFSTTMTGIGGRNVGLSGKGHSVTAIPFTEKGAPIFDSVAVCDLRLPREIALTCDERLHKVSATRQLKNDIAAGIVKKEFFTQEAFEAIKTEQPTVTGFIWHHHEDIGRMQLVPRKIHEKTGHDGGMKFWPFTDLGGQ